MIARLARVDFGRYELRADADQVLAVARLAWGTDTWACTRPAAPKDVTWAAGAQAARAWLREIADQEEST